MKTIQKLLVMLGLALACAANASASYTSYATEAAFRAAITNAKTDEFNDPGFHIYSNAAMQALSQGNIGYQSTGWGNLNVVVTGTLCWGCNGSGIMDLTSTNVGSASGVYGFAVEIPRNDSYNAYLTFGDNSTLALSSPTGFLGFTSTSLIKSVEFAHSPGQHSTDSFVLFNKVIIGAALVPEPGSLALFGLGLFGFLVIYRQRPRKLVLVRVAPRKMQ
jgi:hypothetical protein